MGSPTNLQRISSLRGPSSSQTRELGIRQLAAPQLPAWYSLLAALFMELGFVEVATRQAPRTCHGSLALKRRRAHLVQGRQELNLPTW